MIRTLLAYLASFSKQVIIGIIVTLIATLIITIGTSYLKKNRTAIASPIAETTPNRFDSSKAVSIVPNDSIIEPRVVNVRPPKKSEPIQQTQEINTTIQKNDGQVNINSVVNNNK